MSIEYYFGCAHCKEYIHVGCTCNVPPHFFEYYWNDPNCNSALVGFLAKHTLCAGPVTLISEDDVPFEDKAMVQVEWQRASVSATNGEATR